MKLLVLVMLLPFLGSAQYRIAVQDKGIAISPKMWGLFFEDINRSADGGVYADMVNNRSFDLPDALMGWQTNPSRREYDKSEVFRIIQHDKAVNGNQKYLQVWVNDNRKNIWMMNDGFGGISLQKGKEYELIFVSRTKVAGLQLKVDIVNNRNRSVATASITPPSDNSWQTTKISIAATDSTTNGRLLIRFEGTGQLDIDRVSLFPVESWKNRKEGLRNDLVQRLDELKPGFLRFPGGCIVEGENLHNRYQWKKTIGPVLERGLISNLWNDGGITNKPVKDYYQSFGLGFFEYFQLCEDLGAEPLPVLNCGMSCQFRSEESVSMEDLQEYIQDALDLVEFANGDVNTTWGSKRSAMGHPAPFNLKYIAIGNENWGPQYIERLKAFQLAIKEKYPSIQLVTSTGYSPNSQFAYLDSALRQMNVDIIDEHYYQTANWFFANATKYDSYDRKGPKIQIGEYACHSVGIGSTDNKNNLYCALAEAVFMTGLERNADIVTMAAYAPLFAHVKNWQWTPNLIWFDNSSSYVTPSYYVQQLFSLNKGTHVLSLTENEKSITGQDSIWASAVIDQHTNELIVKLVNPSSETKRKEIKIDGLKAKTATGTITVLKGNKADENSMAYEAVKPDIKQFEVKNRTMVIEMSPYSFTVIRIKI